MKDSMRAAFAAAGRYEWAMQFFRGLNVLSRCLAEPLHQAQRARRARADASMVQRLSPTLTVLHGPFAGMRYPQARATGSALVPKILGSYESELHDVMATLLKRTYSDIVDIGCAEGYYAVGLGMRHPDARIHAFDTDAVARQMCRDMAQANGVASRLALGSLCDETTLLGLPLGGHALVVSDCEGYEAELFTSRVVASLLRHDVLIEVHDQADPQLGGSIRHLFRDSHDCIAIDSLDDSRKARTYAVTELEGVDLSVRRELLAEGRGMIMEWLFFSSRASAAESPAVVTGLRWAA